MKVPEHTKIFQLSASTIWISEGIVYSIPNPGEPPVLTNEEIKVEMDKFRAIIGNKKVCLVLESNPKSKPPKKEQRDFIASELSSVTKAMAIITSSPVSRIIANLFFGFKPPTYPVKMFTNETEATDWIKQYL